jgi:hypothetical protein
MNIKTVLVGLSLTVFIFCSVQSSNATIDDRRSNYIYFLTTPSEHPWQDSGSPFINDDIQQELSSHIVVINGPLKIFILVPTSKMKPDRNHTQMTDQWSEGKTPR